MFRMATATAINEYCATVVCVISSVRSRLAKIVYRYDIIID